MKYGIGTYLPKEVQIRVKLGDRVKAGETVIGMPWPVKEVA
jgi:hypothetical protein